MSVIHDTRADGMILCPATSRYSKAVPLTKDVMDGIPEYRVRYHCAACGGRVYLGEITVPDDDQDAPTPVLTFITLGLVFLVLFVAVSYFESVTP